MKGVALKGTGKSGPKSNAFKLCFIFQVYILVILAHNVPSISRRGEEQIAFCNYFLLLFNRNQSFPRSFKMCIKRSLLRSGKVDTKARSKHDFFFF